MPRLHIDTYPKADEYKIIQRKAAELNMSMSTYMIFVAVNAKVSVQVEGLKPTEEEIRQTKAFDAYMDKGKEMKQILAKLQKEP